MRWWATTGSVEYVDLGGVAYMTTTTWKMDSNRLFLLFSTLKVATHILAYNVTVAQKIFWLNNILHCCTIIHTNILIFCRISPTKFFLEINEYYVSFWKLSFSLKCNARAGNRQKYSLHCIREFSSDVKQFLELFLNDFSANRAFLCPKRFSSRKDAKTVRFTSLWNFYLVFSRSLVDNSLTTMLFRGFLLLKQLPQWPQIWMVSAVTNFCGQKYTFNAHVLRFWAKISMLNSVWLYIWSCE